MNTNIEIMTGELHKAFKIINKKFFENAIPLPAITIQSSGNRKLAMGWCTTKEIWHDKDGKTKLYEINLSAEFINISFMETMDTLMHEMVHLYNITHNIKDVSRGGTYHNKRFLERALKSGFVYEEDKPDATYGYSFVKLSERTKVLLKELDIKQEVFSLGRKTQSELHDLSEIKNDEENTKKERKTHRWICPSCDMILRSTKPDLNIICGNCQQQLLNVELD